MCETPRAGVMELARQLGVARGTVQARLDKLQKRGIISGFDPDLDLQAMGYEVLAFVTLEIAQGRLDDVIEHLQTIPEVLEAHATTGPGDLHCRVVARTNAHLQHVLGRVLEVPGHHAHHHADRPQRAGAPPGAPARRPGDRRGDRPPRRGRSASPADGLPPMAWGVGDPRP